MKADGPCPHSWPRIRVVLLGAECPSHGNTVLEDISGVASSLFSHLAGVEQEHHARYAYIGDHGTIQNSGCRFNGAGAERASVVIRCSQATRAR